MADALPPVPPHDYDFDPTYGYTVDEMLRLPPPAPPADFDAFWQATFDETIARPLRIERRPIASARPGFRASLIHFDGWQGVRLGAWLIEPHDGVDRYVVSGHGYYNRPFEDISYNPGVATLFFACRGLGLSRTPGISDETARHVLHGIDAKETYVHRGCVADTWSAASAMLTLFPQAAGRLEYHGASFGGGIGAMAVAWDRRVAFARLGVPSFGHHPLRLKCRCVGSGEAVRRKYERHPEIYERTLCYFDAATHATRITAPAAFGCAAFDPSVPPPGQLAVYAAAPGPKRLFVLRTGHHDLPDTAAETLRFHAAAEAFRTAVR